MGKPGVSLNVDTPDLNTPESGLTLIEEYNSLFANKINDDLNMPKAIALVWMFIKDERVSNSDKMSLLEKWDEVLGLQLKSEIRSPKSQKNSKSQMPKEIRGMMRERKKLRKEKKFDEADALREKIMKLGYDVVDKPLIL